MWAVSAPVLQGKRMIAVITVPSPLVRAPQPLQQKLIDQVRDAAQTLNEALRVTRRYPATAGPAPWLAADSTVKLPACRTSVM